MTFIVVPHGGEDLSTRSFEVSYRRLRVVAVLVAIAAAAWIGMAASWWYVTARAARVPRLEREVASLQKDRQRVEQLARLLARMEAQYEQVRTMLGADAPPAKREDGRAAGDSVRAWIPERWPLAGRGFVTRGYGGRDAHLHPGLDIAVARGTPIRALDEGTVLETGENRVYGRFVRLEHRDGYESLYAHASRFLVATGDRVGRAQPIALSGSSGLSTAPHLHLEIRREGQPLDPIPLLRIGS